MPFGPSPAMLSIPGKVSHIFLPISNLQGLTDYSLPFVWPRLSPEEFFNKFYIVVFGFHFYMHPESVVA